MGRSRTILLAWVRRAAAAAAGVAALEALTVTAGAQRRVLLARVMALSTQVPLALGLLSPAGLSPSVCSRSVRVVLRAEAGSASLELSTCILLDSTVYPAVSYCHRIMHDMYDVGCAHHLDHDHRKQRILCVLRARGHGSRTPQEQLSRAQEICQCMSCSMLHGRVLGREVPSIGTNRDSCCPFSAACTV